ncbi:STAS domain-containing protein [Streptomyces sp. NPDC090127]|uniref:STAS domain-containing protein n=1 Tax=Streptomyces sp. NPDC090127 TaxID=3365953 RepID=UPI00382CCAC2
MRRSAASAAGVTEGRAALGSWPYRRRADSPPPTPHRQTYAAPNGAAEVTLEHTEDAADYVLRARGAFDVESVDCLNRALRDVPQTRPGRTVIDVADVEFGDSSFLHALVRAHFQERTLLIAGPLPSELRRLFQVTGSLRMFTVVRSCPGSAA